MVIEIAIAITIGLLVASWIEIERMCREEFIEHFAENSLQRAHHQNSDWWMDLPTVALAGFHI